MAGEPFRFEDFIRSRLQAGGNDVYADGTASSIGRCCRWPWNSPAATSARSRPPARHRPPNLPPPPPGDRPQSRSPKPKRPNLSRKGITKSTGREISMHAAPSTKLFVLDNRTAGRRRRVPKPPLPRPAPSRCAQGQQPLGDEIPNSNSAPRFARQSAGPCTDLKATRRSFSFSSALIAPCRTSTCRL